MDTATANIENRALAHLEKIGKLHPITFINKNGESEVAQLILLAEILGWKVVVKKDEFKEGDLCVYAEIDSIFPPKPEFEFLKEKNYRIKTAKIRGQVSQGIAFPVSLLDNYQKPSGFKLEEGANVTEIIGITKYDSESNGPTSSDGTKVKVSTFPEFLRKTDEERIQNRKWILDKHADLKYYVTEKLDGTSATFYWKDGKFGVCSRNNDLLPGDNWYWNTAEKYKLQEKLEKYGKNVAIQGEIIGQGIQKNLYKIEGHKVMFFSAFDITKQEYMDFEDFHKLIVDELKLETVPILEKDFKLPKTCDEMLAYAENKSKINTKTIREGVVVRSVKNVPFRVSFKAISNAWLLKNE